MITGFDVFVIWGMLTAGIVCILVSVIVIASQLLYEGTYKK